MDIKNTKIYRHCHARLLLLNSGNNDIDIGKNLRLAMEDANMIAITGAPTANNSANATCPGNPQTDAVETTDTAKLRPLSRAKDP
jgi:hypothetical protein